MSQSHTVLFLWRKACHEQKHPYIFVLKASPFIFGKSPSAKHQHLLKHKRVSTTTFHLYYLLIQQVKILHRLASSIINIYIYLKQYNTNKLVDPKEIAQRMYIRFGFRRNLYFWLALKPAKRLPGPGAKSLSCIFGPPLCRDSPFCCLCQSERLKAFV